MNLLGLLSVISSLTFIASEVMGIYVYRLDKKAELNRLFFICCQSLAVWSLGLMFIYQTGDVEGYWLGDKTSALGWISFSAILLHMNVVLTEHIRYLNQKWKLLLLYAPVLCLLVWELVFLGPTASDILIDEFYTAFNAYYMTYGVLTLLLLVKWGWNNASKRKRMQAAVVFTAGLLALIIAYSIETYFVLDVAGRRAEAMHPVMFILLLGFWYAVQRYGLFNMSSLIDSNDIVNRVTEMVIVVNTNGTVLMVNPRYEELTGYSSEESVGIKLDQIVGEPLDKICPVNDQTVMEATIRTRKQENVPILFRASFIYDRVGDLLGYVLLGQDMRPVNQLKMEIEIRKRKEAELEYSNFHDPVTGMYNRTYFEKELQRIEKSQCFPQGIIIADIDGLKLVNDTFGHVEGDALLLASAEILKRVTENRGTVARIGGDEFAILLTDFAMDYIADVEENLLSLIKEYNSRNQKVPLSISTGSAVSHSSEKNILELFKIADGNMYRAKLNRRQSARSKMVQALLNALEARNVETKDHAKRLQKLALQFGKNLGMSQYQLNDLSLLAQFHDLGKVGMPDKVLLKRGPLNEAEWQEMQQHPEIGCRIAQSVPEFMPIARLILLHHERWDGQGYPLGLMGEKIPLECRIIAIVDAYDAMTNARPYREAMVHEKAMEELLQCAGEQFDPNLVVRFVRMMRGKIIAYPENHDSLARRAAELDVVSSGK
ncbi:MAG: diguanylate cyclase and metal dependent phosphohydrolase [Firmicutes bacterium]|nr:diguanylate cyclase and metal dependent phosphohydrolase [Bacillota bacterium]